MPRFVAGLLLAAVVPAWTAEPVRARHGMVVTREPHATRAGLDVLRDGGNAVDAAVAVGFALAVTHPSAGNIGGGGFMLVRMADGRTAFLDFREQAPRAANRNMYVDSGGKTSSDSLLGYRASGVPGTVRGLELALKKFGSRPWAELIRPAAELASHGFPLSYAQARSLRGSAQLAQFPESKRIFHRGGDYFDAGDVFSQPDLARTLNRIAQYGASDFYEGQIAQAIASDMAAHQGLITLDDLKNYQAVERAPLKGAYHGFEILTAPPPSSGGVGILQSLGILSGTGYERSGAGSASVVHYVTEALRRYFCDRAQWMGDSDFVKVPVLSMLDPTYLAGLRRSIDPEQATPSGQLHAGAFSGESAETTHYSVADASGNVALVTYTLNGGYGSKVTATGLGFLLNNEMDDFASQPGKPNMYGLVQGEANAIQPGKRPLSSMTPTLIMRDGKPYLALGSPGGPTIISTVLEVALNVMDFGMGAQDAVDWPRFHHQWLPDELQMERGYSPDTARLLESRGYKIRSVNAQGEVAAIMFENGWLAGAADRRAEGSAEGY